MDPLKPNILVITCHDLGDYLGCYGTPVATPHLDRLAREGIFFTQHFAAASVCSPSRASLWTGCYAHTHGLMGLVPRGWEMDVARCPHAATLLQTAGYRTHLFGLQHEHWDPYQLGFEEVHAVSSNYGAAVTPVVVDWLANKRPGEAPFFAAVGFFEVHRIGSASQGPSEELLGQLPSHFQRPEYEPDDPDQVAVRPYLPDIPGQRAELADFYGAIKFMDRMVGEILQALDDSGLADTTWVLFTSDHGASFLHSKATLYDGGLKVPLIMRLPGVLPAGKEVATLVSHIDVLPTILDMIGAPLPAHIEGRSFLGVALGRAENARDALFAEKNYTIYFDPARMVRTKQYKYIRNGLRKGIFDFVLPEIEMSQASFRNDLAVFKHYDSRRVLEELYDLADDPAEMNNVASDPHYQEPLQTMRATLDQHLEDTADPFRRLRNEILLPADVYPDVKGIRST